MLAETIEVAKNAKLATNESLTEVCIDTNVQTKAVGVLGVNSFASVPFDGHTIPEMLTQNKSLTGGYPAAASCGRGYQGSAGQIFSTQFYIQGKSSMDANDSLKKKLLGRAGIDPVIGHMKAGHRIGRNFLPGTRGDQIDSVMSACGLHMPKLHRAFLRAFLFADFYIVY